jgi:hypothetical protein
MPLGFKTYYNANGSAWWQQGEIPAAVIVVGLVVLSILLVLAVVTLFLRARRRERMMVQALSAGQPEIAMYIIEGPRRLISGLILPVLALAAVEAASGHEEEIAWLLALSALVPLYFLLKRPKIRKRDASPKAPPRPTLPPAEPFVQAPREETPDMSQPNEAAGPEFSRIDDTPPPPSSDYSAIPRQSPKSALEIAIAVVTAILVLFAGLILIRVSPLLVFIVGLCIMIYLLSGRKRRGQVAGFSSRQVGKVKNWLDRKADQHRDDRES